MPRKTPKPAIEAPEVPDQGIVAATPQEAATEPPKKKKGRPTAYDEDLACEICVRLANGEALRQICMEDDMPAQSTVYLWLTRHPSFSEMYARAREDQADTLADEIQAISDEMPLETTDKEGNTKFDSAYIQWMRLRVDSRKWIAAKLKPRKYGERMALAGDAESPLKVEADVTIFDAIIKNLEAKRQTKVHGG